MLLAISTAAKWEEVCATPSITHAIIGYETATVTITNNEPGAMVVFEAFRDGVMVENGQFTGDSYDFSLCDAGDFLIKVYATLEGKTDSPEASYTFTIHEGERPVTSPPTIIPYTEEVAIGNYYVEICPTEPSWIYYRIKYPNGTWSEWAEYDDILIFNQDGEWRIEAYALADGKEQSEIVYHEFMIGEPTGLTEVAGVKSVESVRYYNMAGQEMSQATGLTIVVTTYTDGTRNIVKVLK